MAQALEQALLPLSSAICFQPMRQSKTLFWIPGPGISQILQFDLAAHPGYKIFQKPIVWCKGRECCAQLCSWGRIPLQKSCCWNADHLWKHWKLGFGWAIAIWIDQREKLDPSKLCTVSFLCLRLLPALRKSRTTGTLTGFSSGEMILREQVEPGITGNFADVLHFY